MDNIILDLGRSPVIDITSVGGDLRVTGWEQPQFTAESSDDDSVHVDQHEGGLSLRAGNDCTIRLPQGARLTIQKVGGDARIKALHGPLRVGRVGGDLTLRQTAAAEVDNVGGDLSAKKASGDLHVGQVGGDLSVRGLAGDFKCGRVGGDLYLRDVEGGIQASAGGDMILVVNFMPGHEYSAAAAGDLTCRLAAEVSARISLTAGGDVVVDVPSAQIEGGGNRKTVTLGGGEAAADLRAGGDLIVTGLAVDPEAMGDFGEHFGDDFGVMAEEFATHMKSQIETQIEGQMADFEKQMTDLSKQLEERMAGVNFGPGRVNAEEIAARARRAAERMERAARQKAEAAQRRVGATQARAEKQTERARRLAEAAQRRAEGRHPAEGEHGRSMNWAFKFDPQRPPAAPAAKPAEPVSDEERMVILRMLEQGKISVADAEKLLAALEDK